MIVFVASVDNMEIQIYVQQVKYVWITEWLLNVLTAILTLIAVLEQTSKSIV
jgi:hypothetical protein